MEHSIRAPRDGVVRRIARRRGRPRRGGRGAGGVELALTAGRLADNRGMESWEGSRDPAAAPARARHRLRGRPARRPPERGGDPSRRGARRVRRPADRRGPAGDRGRLVRVAEGDSAARRHRGALPPDPPRQRRALPGARPESAGPRARAGGRACARSPSSRRRPRRSTARTSTPASTSRSSGSARSSRARRRRRSACAATSRPAFGCPYEGDVAPEAVREVVHKLLDLAGRRDLGRGHDRRGDARRRLRRHRDALRVRRDARRARAALPRHARHGARQRLRRPRSAA